MKKKNVVRELEKSKPEPKDLAGRKDEIANHGAR
jgi:hypothetical protein